MKDYLEEAKGLEDVTGCLTPENDDTAICIADGIWVLAYAVIALVDRIDQIAPILQDISRSQRHDLRT